MAASYAGRFVTAPGGYPGASRWAPPRCTSEVAEPRDAAGAVSPTRSRWARRWSRRRSTGTPVPCPDVATLRGRGGRRRRCGAARRRALPGPGDGRAGLAAGVAALAHTPWTHRLDDEVVAEAVEAGQAWISTLDIHGYGTRTADQDRAVDNLARFHAAGGRVLYGTDLGNGPLPETLNLREIDLLLADAGSPTTTCWRR